MAEESDLERTEPASPRRLEKAREEGNVPHSRELATFLVLIAGVGGLWVMGSWLASRTSSLIRTGLSLDRRAAYDADAMMGLLRELSGEAVLSILPLLLVLVVAALGSSFLVGGFVFSSKALSADLNRLNPLKGLGRMVSVNSLAELVKAVLKALLVGGIAAWALWLQRDGLFALALEGIDTALPHFGRLLLLSSLFIVTGIALIAAIDVPFQLWQYYSKLKMTKEELRQEMKETEGDPQVKGRIRAQQREMARRRMMAEVPKADVVVTNPTHYAVALKYDAAKMGAPRVVAKGMNIVAQNIRELAAEHAVPLLEAPPLARALYRHTELGDEVPAALYTAVAEVMAYVYQLNVFLREGGLPPQPPARLPVPAELDPGVPAGEGA